MSGQDQYRKVLAAFETESERAEFKRTQDFRSREWRRIADPKWSKTGRVHDWRNYISAPLRVLWDDLPMAVRGLLYIDAEHQANNEEWD